MEEAMRDRNADSVPQAQANSQKAVQPPTPTPDILSQKKQSQLGVLGRGELNGNILEILLN